MAKTSVINRDLDRRKLVASRKQRRDELRAARKDPKLSPEERFSAQTKLSKMPRDSSKIRLHNRCQLSGRSKGVFSKFMLSRIQFREMAHRGELPGVTKASW
jgi:small subunit ribosomal protein S14